MVLLNVSYITVQPNKAKSSTKSWDWLKNETERDSFYSSFGFECVSMGRGREKGHIITYLQEVGALNEQGMSQL